MTEFVSKAFRRKDSKAGVANAVQRQLNKWDGVVVFETSYAIEDGHHYAMVTAEVEETDD